MKKIFITSFVLALLSLNAAEITNKNGIYVLSNKYLTAEIAPVQGGKVIRLYDKKNNAELVKAYSSIAAPAGSGLFAERLWPIKGRQSRHYETSAYKVLSAKGDKNTVELKLLCSSKPLDIEKTYILKENEPTLRVRYALSNPTSETFTGRFWSSSVIAPQGDKWEINLPQGPYSNAHNRKGPAKQLRLLHDCKNPKGENHWIIGPTQDYGTVRGSRSGAALIAPFEFLDLFYCHIASAGGANLPTMEWMSSYLHIKPLAVGKADAVNHPELEDPLQDYIVRFETAVTLFEKGKEFAKFRSAPSAKKVTRFQPVLAAGKAHMEFKGLPAVPFFANQKENPRLLMFAGHNISAEAFDFLRRFRSNAEVIEGWRMTGGGDTVYGGYSIPAPIPMAAKLLKEKADVIFIPGFTNSTLPASLKKQLIEKVKKGAVVIYTSDVNRFTELFPRKGGKKVSAALFRGIPFTTDILEYKVGKGKVFFVPFRLHLNNRLWSQNALLLPAPAPDNPHYEHVYALYGRLVRYALNYKSAALIQSVTVKGGKAEITIDSTVNAPAAVNGKAYTLKKGINKIVYAFDAQALNGKYDLNLILDVKGKTCDIFIAQYEVRNLPRIKSFAAAKYAHENNEPVKGRVELEGKGDLKLLLKDAEGRIIGSAVRKNVSGKVDFSIKPAFDGVNSFCRLEAHLSSKGKNTELQTRYVSRRTPDNSKLRFVLWHNSRTTPSAMLRHNGAREMGFTHLMGSQGHAMGALDSKVGAEAILQTGGRYMVNTLYRFFQNQIKKEKQFRNPCLRDPAGLKEIRKFVELRAKRHAQHFPVRYYSSDENSLGWHDVPHDYCRTPHCLAGFRKAMEKHYGSLAKLNQAWKSSFKSWADVVPPTLSEARAKGNFAPWMAHRIYMLSALDEGMTVVLDQLRKVDPQAKLAHSGQGLTRLNDCWDWRKMPRHYNLSNLYARMGGLPDYLRTARPGYPAGNWMGYGAPLPEIRFHFWNDVADGMFAPAYWYDCYFFRRGDNGLNETGLHMKGLLAEIKRSGADPLMTEGRRERSPITLVYSPESLVAASVTGNFSAINDGTYNGNLTGWVRLLRSAGFPAPQIISDDMISQVNVKNTPVLVLPLLQLMSKAQIDHVKKYVLSGGILVIDAQAGIFNEFYTERKNNPLLTLAGVKVPVAKGASGGTLQWGKTALRLIPTGAKAESAGAKAWGAVAVNTPGARHDSIELGEVKRATSGAFFINKAGKGKVIYLNALFHGVPGVLRDPALGTPLIKAFRELFAAVGIKPASSGACDINHAVYTHGRYTVLLMTRRPGSGVEKFTLSLNKEYYIYDTIAHKFLGKEKKISAAFRGYDVAMRVYTAEKLQAPQLKCSAKGGIVTIASASDSGIWFAQMYRNGAELKSLGRNVILDKNKQASFNFGAAPAGLCEVRLLNIMTGEKFNYKAEF